MSRKESELLIIAYALRHSSNEIGLDNLISMIDVHLPHKEYKSKYHFLKSFKYPTYTEYYYCEDCSEILYFNDEATNCSSCSKNYKKNFLKIRTVFYLPSIKRATYRVC